MAASDEDTSRKDAFRGNSHESQEEWISGEELYTEGSSDEDDMALRMRRRERQEARKGKNYFSNSSTIDSRTSRDIGHEVTYEQEQEDKLYEWRPRQGSLKLKPSSDPGNTSSSKEQIVKDPSND